MQERQDNEREDHILALVKAELERQEKLLERSTAELNLMPAGTICKKIINGYCYHYIATKDKNGKRVERIIKPGEEVLKEALIKKRFLVSNKLSYENNIPLMKKFVGKYRSVIKEKEANSLIQDLMFDRDQRITLWRNEPFRSNPGYPEGLIHKTTFGLSVRSKSEAIIAETLEAKGIPFRYEAELILDGIVLYPDFTIFHPSGSPIFWEHFGLMNNSKYKETAKSKLNLFYDNGIYPYGRLILTYDNVDGSIDARDIQRNINTMVLV